jgi:hypothetical protein
MPIPEPASRSQSAGAVRRHRALPRRQPRSATSDGRRASRSDRRRARRPGRARGWAIECQVVFALSQVGPPSPPWRAPRRADAAHHEAGHAVARLIHGLSFARAYILPDGTGAVEIADSPKGEPWGGAIRALAGPVAEARYSGQPLVEGASRSSTCARRPRRRWPRVARGRRGHYRDGRVGVAGHSGRCRGA